MHGKAIAGPWTLLLMVQAKHVFLFVIFLNSVAFTQIMYEILHHIFYEHLQVLQILRSSLPKGLSTLLVIPHQIFI